MYQYHQERPTPHFLTDIAKGNMWDSRTLNLFGVNRTVGTDWETLWDDGGNYVYPTSALIMSAVSSSASDTMALLISGLDENYNEITETVTLNGTSSVSTSASFLRVNSAVILAGSNVGNITISNGGQTYGYITIGVGLAQSSVYTVPAGHSIYIYRIDCTSGTTNGQKYISLRNFTRTSSGRILRVAESTFSASVSFDRQVPFRITEKTDFHYEAKSSSSSNEISIITEALLIQDN